MRLRFVTNCQAANFFNKPKNILIYLMVKSAYMSAIIESFRGTSREVLLISATVASEGSLTMRDDDFADDDDILEEGENTEEVPKVTSRTSKAWRSIERYREMKELRKHLDDFLYEDATKDLNDLRW